LKPIEITLETSGCGRAWTNVQAGVNSSKHFPQTRLGKHYSRQKSSDTADKKKQKRWPHIKQVAGTSKRVCLLDGKAVAPTTSVPEAQKAKQANKKKLQKHDGSLLETKIDTVLNAPGRVQAQIDSLK